MSSPSSPHGGILEVDPDALAECADGFRDAGGTLETALQRDGYPRLSAGTFGGFGSVLAAHLFEDNLRSITNSGVRMATSLEIINSALICAKQGYEAAEEDSVQSFREIQRNLS